jgi:rhodanese-related sulfurtransferase
MPVRQWRPARDDCRQPVRRRFQMEERLNPFARPKIAEVDVDELERLMVEGSVTVVDVREEWEYRGAHLAGVLNIPLGRLPLRVAEIPRDRRVLVICEHGNRSLVGAEFLGRHGFAGVASVKGGTMGWLAGRRPVERS